MSTISRTTKPPLIEETLKLRASEGGKGLDKSTAKRVNNAFLLVKEGEYYVGVDKNHIAFIVNPDGSSQSYNEPMSFFGSKPERRLVTIFQGEAKLTFGIPKAESIASSLASRSVTKSS